jgi:hypothetical protein
MSWVRKDWEDWEPGEYHPGRSPLEKRRVKPHRNDDEIPVEELEGAAQQWWDSIDEETRKKVFVQLISDQCREAMNTIYHWVNSWMELHKEEKKKTKYNKKKK